MRTSLIAICTLGLAAALVSCGPTEPTTSFSTSGYSALGNDFTGNYVKITGARSQPADPKYPCLNQFEVCLPLTADGRTAAVENLCPSIDTPAGTWNFTYTLYLDSGCTEQLANIICPPTLGEPLEPGHNENDVICRTRNADKDFDFCIWDPVTGAGSEACFPCGVDGLSCPQ